MNKEVKKAVRNVLNGVVSKVKPYLDIVLTSLATLAYAGLLTLDSLATFFSAILTVLVIRLAANKIFPEKDEFSEYLAEIVAQLMAEPVEVKKPVVKKAPAKRAVKKAAPSGDAPDKA